MCFVARLTVVCHHSLRHSYLIRGRDTSCTAIFIGRRIGRSGISRIGRFRCIGRIGRLRCIGGVGRFRRISRVGRLRRVGGVGRHIAGLRTSGQCGQFCKDCLQPRCQIRHNFVCCKCRIVCSPGRYNALRRLAGKRCRTNNISKACNCKLRTLCGGIPPHCDLCSLSRVHGVFNNFPCQINFIVHAFRTHCEVVGLVVQACFRLCAADNNQVPVATLNGSVGNIKIELTCIVYLRHFFSLRLPVGIIFAAVYPNMGINGGL